VLVLGQLPEFAAAAFLLIVVPGPSVLFVISRGVALGRRAAVVTALGNAAGEYVHAAVTAFGLGVILERSAMLFTAIKLVGAGYLVVLGVRGWRQRRALSGSLQRLASATAGRRIFREGFVVGVTNPKSLIFFGAVLPQFVDPAAGHVGLQMLLLGLVFVLIAILSDGTWGLAAGTARAWLGRSPETMARLGGASGLVMIGLGLRLAVTGRRD
jgi:threonine/homoserine/homoserine lactone efflux protein